MAIRMSTALQNHLLSSVPLNVALAFGVIEVYSGTQPASADDAPTGTLLGKITENGAAFAHGNPTNGLLLEPVPQYTTLVKAFAQTWVLVPSQMGTAGWWRFKANAADDNSVSLSHIRLDGAVQPPYNELFLETTSLVPGTDLTVSSFQIGFQTQE